MSLGDVRTMMFYGLLDNVNLTHTVKRNTIILLKYSLTVPPGRKNN